MKPLDPTLAAIAEAAQSATTGSLFEMEPSEARAVFDALTSARGPASNDGTSTEDSWVPTDAGNLRVRIYRPARNEFRATTIFLHGGGYMLGGIAQMDAEARLLCAGSESVVVSVDYRLAPEHPMPAAHLDAVAVLQWACRCASQLGGDASKIGIAGESAGANLAASAAISMRDRGMQLRAQLLIVPAPDLAAVRALSDGDRAFPMLMGRDLRAIVKRCLPDGPDVAATFPYSAAHAANLAGLPPAVIGLAGHCPTREIGREYAQRLIVAGNRVHLHEFEALFHPFFAFTQVSASAMNAAEVLMRDYALCFR